MRLRNKVAIVTGAGSGFGEGIAKRFAAEGAKILVNDIDVANGERVAREIVAGRRQCDVSAPATWATTPTSRVSSPRRSPRSATSTWSSTMPAPRIATSRCSTCRRTEFDRIYRVNVKSLFLTARHAVPHFRKKRNGVFITIASTAGVRPRPGLTWYNGSKGAAITTSRSMAAELAPHNIRVNVINPVAGETAMLADFMGQDTPEMRAKFISTIPLGRLSLPADIATAAVFFASDEAAFITGACLEVDGGRCI